MLLSKVKTENIVNAERLSVKFYCDNLFKSYKIHKDKETKPNEITDYLLPLVHFIDPLCHLLKLLVNICRLAVAIFDLFLCALSGNKNNKYDATITLLNCGILVAINVANIILSIVSMFTRTFATIKDLYIEPEKVNDDKKFASENKFFLNIVDVPSYMIPGDESMSGFFNTYNPGF